MRKARHCERSEAIQTGLPRRAVALLAMTMMVVFSLSGCGTKGGLKTPTEIEKERVKEERRKAKAEAKKAESSPSPQGERE